MITHNQPVVTQLAQVTCRRWADEGNSWQSMVVSEQTPTWEFMESLCDHHQQLLKKVTRSFVGAFFSLRFPHWPGDSVSHSVGFYLEGLSA